MNSFFASARTIRFAKSFHSSLKLNGSIQTSQPNYDDVLRKLNAVISNEESTEQSRSHLPITLMKYFRSKTLLPAEMVKGILDASIQQHAELPNVLQVSRPQLENNAKGTLTVCGDTHGQFFDFCEIFREDIGGGLPSPTQSFLFNGDIVDRGPMACEIFLFLLSIKLALPNSVFILRGNHETTAMTQHFGFQKEVMKKYGKQTLQNFRELFKYLPLAAVIEDKIFVCHGGLGPESSLLTIGEMNALDRKVEPDEGPVHEILWSGIVLR
jgi:hypothetical protein